MDFVEAIEAALGKKAAKRLLPMQAGDVGATFAEVADLMELTNFRPGTPVEKGIGEFVSWYLNQFAKVEALP